MKTIDMTKTTPRRLRTTWMCLGLTLSGSLMWGCKPSPPSTPPTVAELSVPEKAPGNDDDSHAHRPGAHGGIMVSLGRDSYHVEAVIDNSGSVRLHTLGQDETRVIDIPATVLNGFVKRDDAVEAQAIVFVPEPQPGDADGRASAFVAKLPSDLQGRTIDVTIPNVTIDGERFRLAFTNANVSSAADSHTTGSHSNAAMPPKIEDQAERDLYLEPGGQYTLADIESNGRTTPSQKFKGVPSAHDMNPKDGDRICPVTKTKANAKFAWVIGGKEYLFCCPPCVDEFLQSAKNSSDPLPDPGTFVKTSDQP